MIRHVSDFVNCEVPGNPLDGLPIPLRHAVGINHLGPRAECRGLRESSMRVTLFSSSPLFRAMSPNGPHQTTIDNEHDHRSFCSTAFDTHLPYLKKW
jgi:hypothetical protein